MAKGHVGRPTNEEVAARKRKQLLKVLIPCILIGVIAVMIITQTGLKGLMGATIGSCTCDEGWELTSDNKCQKTNTITSEPTAEQASFMVGDVDHNGTIDNDDLTLLQQLLNNPQNITNEQKALANIYIEDDNEENNINDEDVKALDTYLKNVQAPAYTNHGRIGSYVCPENTTTETTDADGNKVISNITYEPNGNYCTVTTTKTTEKIESKGASCSGLNSTGSNYDNSTDTLNDGQEVDVEEVTDEEINDEDYCEYIGYNNSVCDSSLKNTSNDEDSLNDEFDDTGDNEDTMAVLKTDSNYLKYAVDTSKETTSGPGYSGWIYLKTINSKTNKSIQNAVSYEIYSDKESCNKGIGPNPNIELAKTNYDLKTIKGNKVTNKAIIYGIHIPKTPTKFYWIKQSKQPSGYKKNTSNTCRRIPAGSIDGYNLGTNNYVKLETKVLGYKKFKKRIRFTNDPISYTVKVAANATINGKRKAQDIVYYDSQTTIENKASKSGYVFNGWKLTRTNSNGQNTQTYCYKNSAKKTAHWEAGTICKYGARIVGTSDGKVSFSKINAKDGYILTFTPEWKQLTLNVSVVRNNQIIFSKPATVRLYIDSKCKNDKRTVSTSNGMAIFNNLTPGKTYYIKSTSAYSTGSSCVKLTTNNKEFTKSKKINMEMNRYVIKYNSNGGIGTMNNSNVQNGKTSILNANTFKKAGKKFSYWTATYNNKTYCYKNNKKNSGIWTNSCAYGVYKFNNKESIKDLVSSGNTIIMTAHWK